MSRTSVSKLYSPNRTITVVSGTNFYSPGMVVQTQRVRSDAKSTYSMPGTGNGTSITDLGLTITPKFSTSLLVMTWMITHEVTYNMVFTVFRDGALITTAGYEGYNNEAGNVRWSGVVSGIHDRADISSTPTNAFIQYAVPAVDTAARTYTPATKSSDAGVNTFYLNRAVVSTGADTQENGVSTGIIMEVAQ
jgi:hypothetical protein